MKKYYFQLGYSCNDNCWHCFLPMSDYKRDLSTEAVKKVLDRAKQDGVEVIALTGGEPTIRPDILEIVEYANSLGFKGIELQTNGRMLSRPGFARKLEQAGVTDIYLSIHSNRPEVQNFITRTKSFDEVVAGIRNVLKTGIRLQTNTVISSFNYRHLDELVEFLVSLGVKEIELDFLRPLGNAWKFRNVVVPKKEDVAPYIEKALETGEKHGVMMFLDDYPVCFMDSFYWYNADYIAYRDDSSHDEDAFNISDTSMFVPVDIHEGEKIKGPPCESCILRDHCDGDWKEYIAIHGWEGFRPVAGFDGRHVKHADSIKSLGANRKDGGKA